MSSEVNNDYAWGIHPVTEILENNTAPVEKLYIRQGLNSKPVQKLETLASAAKVVVSRVPGRKLMDMVGKVNDQGVVVLIGGLAYTEFEEWIGNLDKSTLPFVVVLDAIEDVHNFGAILRSAAAAGADAVIVPKHGQAPVSGAVIKASAGTAGKIPLIRVVNINQTLIKLKDEGFWAAGLDAEGDQKMWEVKYDTPFALVVGSEHDGISKKTLEHCDFRVSVPMSNNVESLNASVSAALLLFEVRRQRYSK